MFEMPIFLLAAFVGGAIPLLLHLMQRRRLHPHPFPTLRFLRQAQKASSRRLRIEHVLLWLVRTLIMVLLGAGFAMPVLRTSGGGLFGEAPRDVAIVLDISSSMRYSTATARGTVFDQAIETAVELIGGLGENDRYLIVLAASSPRALIAEPVSDKDTGVSLLRALSPADDGSLLLPAVAVARERLQATAGRRQQEIHILTDNQAAAWRAPTAGRDARSGAATAGQPPIFFVTLLGAAAPENVAPHVTDLRPPVMAPDGSARITVELIATGPPRETAVTFFVNDQEQARRAITAGLPREEPIVFVSPPLPPGIHAARIETPTDNLAVDDAFYFLLRVRDTMPMLLCGAEPDTFFLRSALKAAHGGTALFTRIEPDALADTDLNGFATVFLCNALPVTGQAIAAVERFVRGGGLLVLFPGSRAGLQDYRAWTCLPALPRELREWSRTQARRSLLWTMPEHPVLAGLEGAISTPVTAIHRKLAWDLPGDGTQVLMTTGEGVPLLIERPFGEGSVLAFAIAADRSWSTFPLTPFFLPIVVQIAEYGSGFGAVEPFFMGGDRVPLDRLLPAAPPDVGLVGPDGMPVAIRRALQDGQTRLYIETVRQPGIYRRTDTDPPSPAFAVNLPRDESDLAPVDPDSLADLLAANAVKIATDRESLMALIREHRVGRTCGELLLWFVLFLVAVEFVYANRLARDVAPFSASVTIESSGRVRARAVVAGKGVA